MTKVLHVAHVSIPTDARILRELNALGESTNLSLYAYGVLEVQSSRPLHLCGLTQFRLRSARATWLPRPLRYALVSLEINSRFTARLMKLRPDIVHCHDTMVLPSGALAKALLGAAVVYDAHELESDKAGQSRALSMATLLIERASWPYIDRLITVSPSITAWYNENLGPKNTTCILNSPEVKQRPLGTQAVAAPRPGVRARLGIGTHVPLFVYVGALETGRGIELLLETFAGSSAGAHIAFIGWGALREQIEQTSQQHANIHYCPRVPHDELVPFIREATGGFCLIEDVSLSDHFCLPNKLFEYAFAGLPVIASRLPDIERVVNEFQLGVCADLSVGSIEKAILECIASPRDLPIERLHQLSWERQKEHLKDLYSDLVHDAGYRTPTTRTADHRDVCLGESDANHLGDRGGDTHGQGGRAARLVSPAEDE